MKHNQKAEIEVLGAMMNNKESLLHGIAELDEGYFGSDETKALFKRILDTGMKHNKADASLVEKQTKSAREKTLVKTADSAYIDVDNFKAALEEVKNIYFNNQLQSITKKAQQAIEGDKKASEIIEMINDGINNLYYDDQGTNIINPKEYAQVALDEFLKGLDNPDITYGLRFSTEVNGEVVGFPGLDEVFRGAQGGDLFLIAAKTGEGKTALANNIARIFSLYQSYSGYYENTEMKVKELLHRILAPIARVTVDELSHSQIEGNTFEREAKIERIKKAHKHYEQSGLVLSRIPLLTATKAKALAKQVKHLFGKLDYLFIDYIGRMDLEQSKGMQEWQVLFKIIQQMKELAMDLDIPVFVLAQRTYEGYIEGAKKLANECDGVLYFEPVTEKDEDAINQTYLDSKKRNRVNYKIIKRKIRRSSNTFPIWCEFDKDRQFINEI